MHKNILKLIEALESGQYVKSPFDNMVTIGDTYDYFSVYGVMCQVFIENNKGFGFEATHYNKDILEFEHHAYYPPYKVLKYFGLRSNKLSETKSFKQIAKELRSKINE